LNIHATKPCTYLNGESGLRLSITSNISNFVAELAELAEQRNSIWEKYRNSLSFVAKLKELEAHSSEIPAISTSVQSNALGSGQAPEEICLAISEVEAELEDVKLLEAEIEGIEKEIVEIQCTYGALLLAFLLIGVIVWLWHVGFLAWLLKIVISILQFGIACLILYILFWFFFLRE